MRSLVTRRGRGLLGLLASAVIAAGALGAWLAWSVPTPVRLARPAASIPAAPAALAPVTAATPRGHRPSTAGVVAGTSASPPVALAIPAIGVRAGIVPEGLGRGGALAIPPPRQVGWYDRGPAPGQGGTTLLAGHIDDYGVPGAFLHLNDVQAGATVRVTVASGQVADYTVTRRLMLPQAALTRSGLLSQQGTPELVLITCGGAYDTASHLYLDNIVIVATPVR
ncbi:MAG TPA: class F sortase [Streptosporangiaceae bacterium]